MTTINGSTIDDEVAAEDREPGIVDKVLGVVYVITVWCVILLFEAIAIYYYNTTTALASSSYHILPLILLCIRLTTGSMAIVAHIGASLGDPGYVDWTIPPDGSNVCIKCTGSWKPLRAHHCSRCQRCVYRMDHHCIWINNCVGYKNQKLFILFLIYTLIFSATYVLHVVRVIITYVYTHILTTSNIDDDTNGNEEYRESIALLFVVGAISAYGLYSTVEYLSDQIDNLETNTTLIETYKRTRGRRVSSLIDTFTEIAGSGNRLLWLIPINTYIPSTMTEPIYEDTEMFDTNPLQSGDITEITDDPISEVSSSSLRKRYN